MARVVIDANVIISAPFGGNPLKAVTRAMEKDEVYLSESIAPELTSLFPRLSKKLTDAQLSFLQERVEELARMARLTPVRSTLMLSRDAKDDHYLTLCKEVAADYLITGDKDLLDIAPAELTKNGICCQILTPQAFLEVADVNSAD